MGPIVVVAALAFGLALAVLVTAVTIRASVWLYNKMAGGPGSSSSVPEPDFGKALGVAVVVIIVNAVFGSVFWVVEAMHGAGAGFQVKYVNILCVPVSLLFFAGVFTFMLPTSFGRGFLVMLCYLLVCIVVAIVLGIFPLIFLTLLR